MRGGPYKISNYIVVGNCNYLTNAISARPVAVSVDATNWSPYKSGVFNNCKASINHGVTLVGVKGGKIDMSHQWISAAPAIAAFSFSISKSGARAAASGGR